MAAVVNNESIPNMRHAIPNRFGQYIFLLITVAEVLTATAQNTLTNGTPNPDSLGSPTQVKAWTFSANAGDHATVTIAKLSGGASFNPRLEVISPSGYTQGAAAGTVGARLDLQAESTGVYTVLASDSFQTGAGSFQIQLAQIPEPFSVLDSDEGGSLTNGASHLGIITAGDVDLWTITGHSGDRIIVQLSKTAGGASFTPQLELFGPDGTRLAHDSRTLASRVDIQAAMDGTYTVQVSAVTPDGAGSYQLQIVQTPGGLTVPSGDEGGALADDTDQSGTITVGDLDPWTFSANVGERITLQLTKVTGGASFTPQLELIAPDGTRRRVSQGQTGATVDVAIEALGTYVAVVSDAAETGAGTYTLRLTRVTIPIGSTMDNGATVQAAVVPGQTNTGTFLASAGDRIVLRIGKAGTGNFNPWMRLYGLAGSTLLGSVSTASAAEIALTITNTGTFTVRVSDGSGTHNLGGSYRLTLIKPGSPAILSPNDEGGALTNGLATSGTIDLGDIDLWTFKANAGDNLVVRMGELVPNSPLTPSLRLYGPDGVLLDVYGSSGTASEVSFRATNSGTFSVIAADATTGFLTGTGTYRIKLAKTGSPITTDLSSDEGGVLTNATTQTGSIVVGDLDAWNFNAQAGQSIIVRMGELVPSSSLTPYLRLFSPDGVLLAQYASSTVAAEVAVRATNSGTFTVIAADLNTGFYLGSGTYQIKLGKTGSPIIPGPNDTGGTLTNGTMFIGTVSIGGMELWTIAATNGQSLVVRMGELVPNSTLTPYLRIFGPEGALQDQYGSSTVASEVAIQATNSGIFTVVAADLNTGFFVGSGAYRIKLGQTDTPIVLAANDEGGTLTNGWNHTGTIDVGDMDVWSFQALSNETIVVRMGELVANSTLTPYLRLFGPNGNLLSQYGSSTVASEVTARATNSGVYTVIAADLNTGFFVGSGTYRIKLVKTGRPLVIENTDAGGLMTGQTNYDGSLDVGGMAVWEFTACKGDPINLGVGELVGGSSLTPSIRLFSWDGSLLKSASGAGSAQISLVAPGSGTYTVVVSDVTAFFTGSGGFRLSVNGLTTGLKICPEGANTQNSYVRLTGADSPGFTLLTSTNVDTPVQLWERIPASQFDIYDNLNYTNSLTPVGEARRFFRWLGP